MLPRHLLIALGELQRGVREIVGAASHDRISGYLGSVGQAASDEIPWCSAFVDWCMEESGVDGTGKANARSWLEWGTPIILPTLGCVTILRRGTEPWQGHVGFLLDSGQTTVTLLGGNQGDRVSVATYKLADVLGYAIPKEAPPPVVA